ncbi:hypothetical protein [Actinosynnema sp. NPDC023587]|uniref:PP2C family protein-serine/threonine phosphatase n=1 Tax=Actinosynnema sp. NPDC023587 TaxID=3154695 RepID=UPI0033DCFD90
MTVIQGAVGTATSRGPRREVNADAHALAVHGGVTAVAVVDGTGSTPEVADFARVAATVAVGVAARRFSPVLGVVAAGEVYGDPVAGSARPDGAIVVAAAAAGRYWRIAWAGDSAAYGLKDDGTLHRFTTPHTQGQLLRDQGADEQEARGHDHQLLHSLGGVPVGGVEATEAVARLLVLASDGLTLPDDEFLALLADHGHEPQTCAERLVTASRKHSADDITVVVIPHPDTQEGR